MRDATWHPQQIVALGLVVAMVTSSCTNAPGGAGQRGVAPASAPVSTPVSTPAPPDAAAIAALRDASQRILASTPKSIFDPDQKAGELGADVNSLFTFVRDHVREEVYAGVLRGARGTLVSHAGNAWDRSVLLAALLRHHGRDVRFARGRLTPDRATALVTKMFDQARQPVATSPVDVPPSVAARSRDLIASIDARWRSAQSDLIGALNGAGVSLGQNAPVTEAMLTEEAADHAWVEYREGERWVPLDPTAAAQPGETVTTATETFVEIPQAFQHRVTFRVKVEERRNQALAEREAFIWATAAGALHGAHVIFTHQIGQTPLGRWRATPVLVVDQQAYSALSFTDAGLEVATKASNALVGEASRQVQGVGRIGELFGAPAAPPNPVAISQELTGVWLDVEFTDPSGRSESVRREILDRIGPVARAQQHAIGTTPLAPLALTSGVPSALTGLHACAVTAGALDPRVQLERLASLSPAIDDALALQKLSRAGGAPSEAQPVLRRVVDVLPVLLVSTAQGIHFLSQRLASRIPAGAGAPLFYEATPRLAIVSLNSADSVPRVDLRRNALRIVARGVAGQDLVRASLARGVLDGVIEDAMMSQALAGVPNAIPLSTVAFLNRARTEGIKIIAVSARGALATLTAQDVARARLWIALERQKQVIVAPERAPIASASRFAWWQVDTGTGDTIGVLDSGLRGGQLTEDAALAKTVAVPEAKAIGAAYEAQAAYYQALAVQTAAEAQMAKWGILAGAVVGVAAFATIAFTVWAATK
jgi:transglutaminase-like putative cysteine protease